MPFFANSDYFDYLVTRPLSHVYPLWELIWDSDSGCYQPDEDGLAQKVNEIIREVEQLSPPARYHDSEDRLAEFVIERLGWPVRKVGNRWVGGDYSVILQQGGFSDADQRELMLAAAGRIQAARRHRQSHFDEMEDSHQRMLAAVLCAILYHRI